MTKICGSFSGHDASYCILNDGIPEIHNELERFVREKEVAGDSIQFMFDTYKDTHDIQYLVTCYPSKKLTQYKQSLEQLTKIITNNDGKMLIVGHHQAHAANAFYSSNFDDALIITMDGGGATSENDATAFAIWEGNNKHIKHLKTFPMHEINIGGIWTRNVRYVQNLQSGWPTGSAHGSVMSLAALGDPKRFYNDFYKMLTTDIIPASMKPHNQPIGANVGTDPKHPYLQPWRELADSDEQTRYDLAAGLQAATETVMQNMISHALGYMTGKANVNLCLAGGVALNSVAVGKIQSWFNQSHRAVKIDNVYVAPVCGDAGLSIGGAQYLWHHVLGNERIEWKDNFTPYLGKTYSTEEITDAVNSEKDKLQFTNASLDDIIELLDEQNIIAMFNSGSESGRRALGNRSIIADPRNENIKDKLNAIKKRQWYRPVAPSLLAEDVDLWFKESVSSPYMSFVTELKDEVKHLVPAIAHINGSARSQTVTKNDNEYYFNLLKKWKEKTGISVLCNTSLNCQRPVCETPEHAIAFLLKTDTDYLYFVGVELLVSKK